MLSNFQFVSCITNEVSRSVEYKIEQDLTLLWALWWVGWWTPKRNVYISGPVNIISLGKKIYFAYEDPEMGSSWILWVTLNLVTSIFIRDRRDGHSKKEAEIGVM